MCFLRASVAVFSSSGVLQSDSNMAHGTLIDMVLGLESQASKTQLILSSAKLNSL